MSENDHAAPRHAEDEAVAWLARLRAPDGSREQEDFERWYSSSPANADAFDRVFASWEDLGKAGETPIGQDRHASSKQPARFAKGRVALTAVAASAVLALVAIGGHPFGVGPPTLIPAAYASVVGEIRTVPLPDGSSLTLDTDTAVQTAYTSRERRVRLVRGRARFRVARDRRPFIVDAGKRTVTATATTFDVDMTQGKLSISMLDGRGGVAESAAGPVQSVIAGESLTFASATSPGRIEASLETARNWPSGMLSFDDATVGDVVQHANRYARTKIVLVDGVDKLRFTGTFRAAATDELAKMLSTMFNLKMVRSADGIVLAPSAR